MVTLEQLYALGFSYQQIKRRLGAGRLNRVHHNVYAVGHQHLSDRANLFAALLTFGPRAFLSHRTAAAVWKLERLVTMAVQKRLLRPDARDGRATLEEALARHQRRPGMAKVTAVLAVYRRTKSSKSGLERDFDRLLAQHVSPRSASPIFASSTTVRASFGTCATS